MLDVRRIREDPETVRARLSVRGSSEYDAMLDRILELDGTRRGVVGELDDLRARRNDASPRVGELKKEGRHEEAERIISDMRELGRSIDEREQTVERAEGELRELLLAIPNTPDPEVPPGGEEDNRLLREWGEEPGFDFDPAPHWELGEQLGILDFERGAKVAGSGFPAYSGAGARLQRALINYMMDLHASEHGYTELWPPFMVNRNSALGTGHLPKFGDDMYEVERDGLFLAPTAEVPVTNMHAGELLGPEDLPIHYVAYTPCFRREAGAHGKDSRGLIRLHQFEKVELLRFERPEASADALDALTGHAEEVLRRLGLRYRVVLLAGGDLGFSNAKTYDLEVWAPGLGRWLEVSSCSTYTDYQARRAGIRFRPEPGASPEFAHTLNGSALALPRTIIALLESGQRSDGSVELPEAIRPYFGADSIAR